MENINQSEEQTGPHSRQKYRDARERGGKPQMSQHGSHKTSKMEARNRKKLFCRLSCKGAKNRDIAPAGKGNKTASVHRDKPIVMIY
jgi:hypothetical protein